MTNSNILQHSVLRFKFRYCPTLTCVILNSYNTGCEGFCWYIHPNSKPKGQEHIYITEISMQLWYMLGSAIRKINFYKLIPLPLWNVHGSIPLLDPPWNRRHDCCLHRNIDFRISRDAKFIFKISCSTLRSGWNLLHSQILSRVVVDKKYTQW